MSALTRADLDRVAIHHEGRFGFICDRCPHAAITPIYQDGVIRMVCSGCGFETSRVKVADPDTREGGQ